MSESDPNAQITANAEAIDTLELQIEVIDGLIEVSATDITELNVEMKFYTKLDAVDGETLQLVNGDEIDLQGTSAVGGATGTAVSILDTRIVETERGISVTSQDIVSLTSALNDTNLNLAGEANAITNLTTIVEIQGDVITATSSDIVLLTARVGDNEGEISQLNTVTADSTSLLVQSFLALSGSVGAAEGNITQLNTVDLTSTSALVQAHLTLSGSVGDAQGDIVQINTVDVTSTSALVQDFLTLSGSVGTAEGEITQLNTVDVASTSALVQSHLALSGSVGDAEGEITQLNTVTVDSTSALVQAHLTLSGAVDDAEGEIVQLNTVTVDSTSALVQSFLTLSGSVGDAEGEIVQLNTVTVDSTSALVQAHLAVSSTVGDNTAVISTQSESIDGIEANYGVKVDINGRITGFGLNSTAATATPTSQFYVIADKFAVVDPASTGSTPIVPFSIDGGQIVMTSDVTINGGLIVNGTISSEELAANSATFIASGASSGTVTLSNNALHTIREITFIGTGAVTEIIATASYGNAAAGGSFLLDFNGTTMQGVLTVNKTLVTLVAGVTSLVGTNTLTLYLNGPVFGAGSISIYNSYIRALESRR
jgi:hypothetical protein